MQKRVPRLHLRKPGPALKKQYNWGRALAMATSFAASCLLSRANADTWTGAVGGVPNSTWDNGVTPNWNTGTYSDGDDVLFDDSATGSYAVNVDPNGVLPNSVTFNNSNASGKAYTVTGGNIGGSGDNSVGSFSFLGSGTVTLNAHIYTHVYNINAGTVIAGPQADIDGFSAVGPENTSIAQSQINVGSGGTFVLDQGAILEGISNSGLQLTVSGTLEAATGATLNAPFKSASGINTGIIQLDSGASLTDPYGSFSGGIRGPATGTATLNLVQSSNGFTLSASNVTLGQGVASSMSGVTLNLSGGAALNIGATPVGAGAIVSVAGNGEYDNKTDTQFGTLRGLDSTTAEWQGAVAIPYAGAGTISGGMNGTLTIDGVISEPVTGSQVAGPVGFGLNYGSVVVLNNSNTYTGETQILSPWQFASTTIASQSATLKVAAGNSSALNSSSGLNFAGGGTGVFDLNGNPVNVSYLKNLVGLATGTNYNTRYNTTNSASQILNNGVVPSSTITNSGSTNATLTVVQAPGTYTFSGSVKDGASNKTALAFTASGAVGARNQVLTGSSNYSGGTSIASGGFVTAGSVNALGTGGVALSGGTLQLASNAATTVSGATISSSALHLNGSPTASIAGTSPVTLTLTDVNSSGEVGSAFTNSPLALGSKGFTTSFAYTLQASSSNIFSGNGGATFTLQNDPSGNSAIGSGNSGLGYTGIQNSVALELASVTDSTHYLNTDLLVNGVSISPQTIHSLPILYSKLNVTLSYDAIAKTLTETVGAATQFVTGSVTSNTPAFFSATYPVDLYAALNTNSTSPTAYAGFTGSSGTAVQNEDGIAGQTISDFSLIKYDAGNPTSIRNNITASSATSIIQLGITSGHLAGAIGTLTVNPSSNVSLTSVSGDTVAKHGLLSVSGLNLGGTLDLQNNDLDVTAGGSTTLATVSNYAAAGFHGGTWNGTSGIISSNAASDTSHLTAIGVIQNNQSGTALYTSTSPFDGITPGAGDRLAKYTYYGDANLDGKVDGSDYSRIDNGYLTHATGWLNGDFNYDGVIDGSDYTLIDNAFNTQGASLASVIADPSAEPTTQLAGTSPVPEPASLGLFAIGTMSLLGRRPWHKFRVACFWRPAPVA